MTFKQFCKWCETNGPWELTNNLIVHGYIKAGSYAACPVAAMYGGGSIFAAAAGQYDRELGITRAVRQRIVSAADNCTDGPNGPNDRTALLRACGL